MINHKESKQARMASCFLKVLQRDMKTKAKTKNEEQPTNNHKKSQKNKSYQKYNTYHEPLSQKWIDGRHRSLI